MNLAGWLRDRSIWLLLAWLVAAGLLCRPAKAPRRLHAVGARAEPCRAAVPVEVPGQGVACAPAAPGLLPGDVLAQTGPPARMAPGRLLLLGVPLDLNRSSAEELEALPGIGPGLARRIVEARPFAAAGDLSRVPGIGPRRAAALAPLIQVR